MEITPNIEKLIQVFNTVIEYGQLVRSKGLNGLEPWNDIKGLFKDQVVCPKWEIKRNIRGTETTDINEIYDFVHDELDMKGDDSDDKTDHDSWSKKHFFLQLIRIIKNNPGFSFVRLAQIAYNIGQLSIHLGSGTDEDAQGQADPLFVGEPIIYYSHNRLGDLVAYVDPTMCTIGFDDMDRLLETLNEKIRVLKEQSGGFKKHLESQSDNYQEKYLKYKNKYLQLKKSFK